MTSFFFRKRLAALFFIALLTTPLSLVLVPRQAHATAVFDFVTEIESTISAFFTGISSYATDEVWVKEYVLDPLAWAAAQQIAQRMTGSIVEFVNGNGNGSGKAQYVQNVFAHMQQLGDQVIGIDSPNGFLAQLQTSLGNSGSPFAAAITASIGNNYLQGTSLAGFFASAQCTLNSVSGDVNAFLDGHFEQGGWGAWFSLTTQRQNNPFALYQKSQNIALSLVASAQTARSQELSWGQGFMSWCQSENGGTGDTADGNVGDPCTNGDGSPATVATPASIIQGTLQKSLGQGVDKISAADEISEVLAQLVVSMALDTLGGSSGGLSGISAARPGSPSRVTEYQDSPGGAGGIGTQTQAFAQNVLDRINQYRTHLVSILTAVQKAYSAVSAMKQALEQAPPDLGGFLNPLDDGGGCPVSTGDAEAALQLIQAIADDIVTQIASTTPPYVLANKIKEQTLWLAANPGGTVSQPGPVNPTYPELDGITSHMQEFLNAEINELENMPPTSSQAVTAAQQSSPNTNPESKATPEGSFNVSGGTIVSRMVLIEANAKGALENEDCVDQGGGFGIPGLDGLPVPGIPIPFDFSGLLGGLPGMDTIDEILGSLSNIPGANGLLAPFPGAIGPGSTNSPTDITNPTAECVLHGTCGI